MKFAAALAFAALATAAHAQDARVWAVETPKEADAWLRCGTPDPDDQPIAFSCVRGSGQVKVVASISKTLGVRQAGGTWVDRAGLRAPWPLSVNLESKDSSATLRGQGNADEVGGGTLVLAEFSTRAPVATGFRKSGAIRLTSAGETLEPPPAPKGAVRKFLGACK